MKYGISYSRFSSKIQETGDSERRQEAGFKRFIDQFGLVAWNQNFIDRGKSGYHGNHRQGDFGKLLEAIHAGKFPKGSVLVIEDMDRFSRENPLESASELQRICKAGLEVGIVSENKIGSSCPVVGEISL
jgi:DNA invertase Pin-like site-specific DNA recombinase